MGRKKGCRVGRFGFSNYTLTPPDGASPGTSAGTEPSDASRVSPQERNLQRKQREIDELRDRLATSQATSTALVAQVQNLTFQVEETKKKLVLSQGAHRQRIHRINNSDSEEAHRTMAAVGRVRTVVAASASTPRTASPLLAENADGRTSWRKLLLHRQVSEG